MRFWIVRTGSSRLMAVDNASVGGMDLTSLASNIQIVEWRGSGEGEIEYNDRPPLREHTNDVLPYCSYFNQFLIKLIGVTLAQAKTVKIDLVKEVYNTKRQLPFHYAVVAGDYSWDASDDSMLASIIPSLQNAISSINGMVGPLNTAIPALNTADSALRAIANSIISQTAAVIAEINAGIVAGANANIVAHNITFKDEVSLQIVDQGNLLIDFINNVVLGLAGSGGNTVNGALQGGGPGLSGDIAHWTGVLVYPTSASYSVALTPLSLSVAGSVSGGVSWTPLVNVPVTNTLWIPYGLTSSVTVTPAEAAAITQGVVTRNNNLNIVKNTKIGQINALSTVADVVAYDVTTGW